MGGRNLKVTETHFNHGQDSPSRSLTLQADEKVGSRIISPEWREALWSKPVAYVTGDFGGPVTVKARLSGGSANDRLRIRADSGVLLGVAETAPVAIFDSGGIPN